MPNNIEEDQLLMKDMEIDLSELNVLLMPELSDSANLIVDKRHQREKTY